MVSRKRPDLKKNKKWNGASARTKLDCICDKNNYRSRSSHKFGVYKVYKSYDKLILKCMTCHREQSFKVIEVLPRKLKSFEKNFE